MNRTEIKILMMRKGVTQASIAKQLHIKPVTVCLVIKRVATSRRVQMAIARALGMSFEELWSNHRAA
jgi:lambda repressor-like predicted transcriptional regulator